jgi:DNA-binding CsgD family transcriptional regulator/tetratricopeptide (TPR) repeat protein
VSEAAARTPVVALVEDAHWLDRPTADVLAFVARRVESDPVVVLAAIRDGYASSLLTAGLAELHLDRLAERPALELLDARFPDLPPAVRARVAAEADGNPLALLELPAARGTRLRGGRAALADRLPQTERLEKAFAARAAELPRATRTLLLIAAADDESALAQVLGAAAMVLGADPAVSDLVPAIDARLIEVAAREVRFRHPLVRSALYQAASVAERHAAHAALASVLSDDPSRRVWHRAAAATGTNASIAAELQEAARLAKRRGGSMTAGLAFERAAALTPDAARRGLLLLSAAEAVSELGDTELVVRLLAEAGSCPLAAYDRSRAMWLEDAFTEVPAGDSARVHTLVETARQMADEKHPRLALNLLMAAAFRCYCADLGPPAASEVLAAADQAGAAADDPLLLLLIQASAAPISRGAIVGGHLTRLPPAEDPEAAYQLGIVAHRVGDFHLARSLLVAASARLREQGRLRMLAVVLATQAWAAIMSADFAEARPAAEEAGRLSAETVQPLWQAAAWTAQAALAALRGEETVVEDMAARVGQAMPPVGASEPFSHIQYARGLLALGQGRHADAYAHLRRLHEPGGSANDQRSLAGAIGDLAEAAVYSGHRDDAFTVAEQLKPLIEQTPSAWYHVSMRYAEALLAEDKDAEAGYAEALSRDLSRWPLVRARLQLAFGQWLRRQRRITESRAPLRSARDAFDVLGTTPWGDRARRELRASGETSRHRAPGTIDQLTPQELQIAQLAAKGLSNRDIGDRLYLSHRTVESHLYRVFPKLGITSRAQLGNALAHSGSRSA